MPPVNCVKLSVSLPKQAKRFAEIKTKRLAKARGENPNISRYIADLILNDREKSQPIKEAA